jgi:hypothetical protein
MSNVGVGDTQTYYDIDNQIDTIYFQVFINQSRVNPKLDKISKIFQNKVAYEDRDKSSTI